MKRITLLIGILVVLSIFLVPPLPAGQTEPNRPAPEKTDIKVLVFRLENEVDTLQKQVRMLQTDNSKNKTAADSYKASFAKLYDEINTLRSRIDSCCASKQSSGPIKRQERVAPKK